MELNNINDRQELYRLTLVKMGEFINRNPPTDIGDNIDESVAVAIACGQDDTGRAVIGYFMNKVMNECGA